MVATGMLAAGIASFVIGAGAARRELARAGGLDRIVTLGSVCFAVPLAVFGALHLFAPGFVAPLVPRYMPWHALWVPFVGWALVATSLSIATDVAVRWSGFFFGVMMFLFVAMIHLPGALRQPDRFIWTIVFREASFGGAGWLLAASATGGAGGRGRAVLLTVGRILVAAALVLFGVEHFLHPLGLPGVPLRREMPTWVPARVLVDYATGAALLAAAASVTLNRKTRAVTAVVGGWLLLMVVAIYGPVLIGALSDPKIPAKVEGINYFADTLLFAGVVLAAAKASRRSAARAA